MQAQRTQTSEINAIQSLNLVKNLLRSGLSCIAFMRGMFPTECFKQQKISGITVHTLQPTEPEPRKLMDWIDQGCLPSLEKRYLEELIFAVYAKLEVAGEDQFYLVETYNFQIRYHENDVVMTRKAQGVEISRNIPTKQEISQATVSMIRSLITMGGTMPPLPDDRAFSIKLLYRDDVTPEDYQPLHFQPVLSEHQLCFYSKPEPIAIGNIATPYHELNLHVLVPEDSEKELAIKFSATRESGCKENFPAYTATINDSISPTLSDYMVPCSPRSFSGESVCGEPGEGLRTEIQHVSSSSKQAESRDSARDERNGCKINSTDRRNSSTISHEREIESEPVAQKEARHMNVEPNPKHQSPSVSEISEILTAIRNGIYSKVPVDIHAISSVASEKLDQLIEMYTCKDFDEMQSLYLQLEIILFLSGGAPLRAILKHFRKTKLSRTLIREHLNALVESGLAIRNNKNQVIVNKDAIPQSQLQKPPVDDDAETRETEDNRAIRAMAENIKQLAQQTARDSLTKRLQKHIEKGVAVFTQSDVGTSQVSRASPKTATKRKISTSDNIYQTSNKRTRL